MKFTVERAALVKMLKLTGGKSPNQKRRNMLVRLSACSARVFVEANEMTAGVEALVLEDGTCLLDHSVFIKVLRTYAPKAHISIRVDERTLKLGSTTLRVSGYSRTVSAPGKFQVIPLSDISVLLPDAQQPEAGVEDVSLKVPRLSRFQDPSVFNDAVLLGVYHYERGITSFSEWSAKMVEEVGEEITPFLQSVYDAVVKMYESHIGKGAAKNPPQLDAKTDELTLDLLTTEAQAEIPNAAIERTLKWEFFAPEILNRLFVFYTHGEELDWAERMWTALGAQGLTNYATAAEYNRVLVRLAVLARYLKCWIWKAYDDSGDPYWEDYDDWLEVLPLVRSALPPSEPSETKGQQPDGTDATRDLLAKMIWAENDAVFAAVLRNYGECDEIELAHDLRHACGMRDDFGAHAKYGSSADDLGEQKKFFDECGLSLREFDCVSVIIGNRFCF